MLIQRAGGDEGGAAVAVGATPSLMIKGQFDSHVYDLPGGKTELKYAEPFSGIAAAVDVFKYCYHAQVDRLMDTPEMPEESLELNALQTNGVFSLACCSNGLCMDDDYDGTGVPQRNPPNAESEWKKGGANGKSVPETGNCRGTAFFDWWRVRCPLVSGKTSLTSLKEQLKTKSQIRLLKNIDANAGLLTTCEFPRMGKTYAKCDPKELDRYAANFCKRFSEEPEDIFTCGGDDEYSAQWRVMYPQDCADVPEGKPCWACHDHPYKKLQKNAFCQCRVPMGWFEMTKAIDDSATCKETPMGSAPNCRNVVGYTLKLGIAEEGGFSDNNVHWKSVRTCEVTSYEWYTNALEPSEWTSSFEFQQDFVMVQAQLEYDPGNSNDALLNLIFLLFLIGLVVEFIAFMRNKPCQCCGKRLKFGALWPEAMNFKRCFWCWLYSSPLPDPTLFAALQARDEHLRGKDFFQYCVQGPDKGRFKYVGNRLTGRKVYVAPRMKAVDHKFSMQKPIKIKDLMLGYDQKKNAKVAPKTDELAVVE